MHTRSPTALPPSCTDQSAANLLHAVQQLALTCSLPYPLISALRGLCTCTPACPHTTTKANAHAVDALCDLVGVVARARGPPPCAGGAIPLPIVTSVVVLVMRVMLSAPPLWGAGHASG